MTNLPSHQAKTVKQLFLEFFTKTLPALFLSLTLFVGGIALLYLRIPKWSLFLGVPTVQLGIVFLVFAFDKIAQARIPEEFHTVPCSICKNPTPASLNKKEAICLKCRQKIAQKLQKAKKV